jgi:hypothetical protein
MDCVICAEKFNSSTRAKISCYKCEHSACKTCIRTFLTTSPGMPQCMNCHTQFNLSFLVRHLNQSWTHNEYKQTMKSVLLNSELGKVPETLPYAETEKRRLQLQEKNVGLRVKIDSLKKQIRDLSNAYTANSYLMRGEDVPARYINQHVTDIPIVLDTRKKFIMACPHPNCKGFLSTAYKCGLCEQFTCKECIMVKEEGHVCLESNRLSAALIRKETKPCPICNERIYKIDGCDQMFCMAKNESGIICQTTFSWKSGEVLKGVVVHNPHFFQLQREGGITLRNARDVHCGGMPDINPVLRFFRQLNTSCTQAQLSKMGLAELDSTLKILFRRLSEHIQYTIPPCRIAIRDHPERMRANRIKYILTSLSREQFADIQYRAEKDHQRNMETLHVMELIGVCGIETFLGIVQELPTIEDYVDYRQVNPNFPLECIDNIKDKLKNLEKVREFCNDKMKEISVTYNSTVNIFTEVFNSHSKKFKVTDVKKLMLV